MEFHALVLYTPIIVLCFVSQGLSNMIILTGYSYMKVINLDTGDASYLLTDLQSDIYSIDYDYKNMYIYFPRFDKNDILRFKYPSEKVYNLETVTVADKPTGLAIDPANDHLYWTEQSKGNLYRSNLDGSKKTFILQDDIIFALTIDFKERWLYYSTLGTNKTISRSRLDGSEKHTFIDVKFEKVTGISIDYNSGQLYWMENVEGVLKSTDSNGTYLMKVSSTLTPGASMGISAYDGDIYCSNDMQLLQVKIFGGLRRPFVIYSETDTIHGVLYINEKGQYPVVNTKSDNYVVDYGRSVTTDCSFQTSEWNPVREIYWQFNNSGVITHIAKETKGISGSSIETPSLTIFNATSSESGTYICYVKNDIGTGQSKPIYVTITGDVPMVFVGGKNYTIGYGNEITLSCNISSNPPVNNVYWEKVAHGSKHILNNWTIGIQGVSVDTPSLTIMESTTADIGTYRCVAINDIGTGFSEFIKLDVIGELPTVTIADDLPEIKYGEKVRIFCAITGNPPPTKVYWEKIYNGISKVISNGTLGTEGITVDNPSMTLLHATDSDSGLYKCFAVNVFGMGYSSSTKLTVIGGLPEVVVLSITHLTGTGYTITLPCVISNVFPVVTKVYWQRHINGHTTMISSDSLGYLGVTVKNPSLVIKEAMETMSGEYTCFAINSVGTGSSLPVQLSVQAGVTQQAQNKENVGKQDHKVSDKCETNCLVSE
ncbi:hemicentin-2-like [Mytilus trossulus]|uniref:hemicentin-2-like n=1 Tax=Mytilus trossulus TaxID=6551 RepID=UPI003005D4AF